MIVDKVKIYPIAGVEAVSFFYDATHISHEKEENWLNAQRLVLIFRDGHFEYRDGSTLKQTQSE